MRRQLVTQHFLAAVPTVTRPAWLFARWLAWPGSHLVKQALLLRQSKIVQPRLSPKQPSLLLHQLWAKERRQRLA
ncbi:MAG TPA: hypothetical protein VMI32_08310 [Candidatus Solibacter sp.]|nr:hypothetical protein [Candidatus Solibacter sp.]